MIAIINEIIQNKINARIEPHYATYVEVQRCALLSGFSKQDCDYQLNQLYLQGKIKVHRGINDKLIEI